MEGGGLKNSGRTVDVIYGRPYCSKRDVIYVRPPTSSTNVLKCSIGNAENDRFPRMFHLFYSEIQVRINEVKDVLTKIQNI